MIHNHRHQSWIEGGSHDSVICLQVCCNRVPLGGISRSRQRQSEQIHFTCAVMCRVEAPCLAGSRASDFLRAAEMRTQRACQAAFLDLRHGCQSDSVLPSGRRTLSAGPAGCPRSRSIIRVETGNVPATWAAETRQGSSRQTSGEHLSSAPPLPGAQGSGEMVVV